MSSSLYCLTCVWTLLLFGCVHSENIFFIRSASPADESETDATCLNADTTACTSLQSILDPTRQPEFEDGDSILLLNDQQYTATSIASTFTKSATIYGEDSLSSSVFIFPVVAIDKEQAASPTGILHVHSSGSDDPVEVVFAQCYLSLSGAVEIRRSLFSLSGDSPANPPALTLYLVVFTQEDIDTAKNIYAPLVSASSGYVLIDGVSFVDIKLSAPLLETAGAILGVCESAFDSLTFADHPVFSVGTSANSFRLLKADSETEIDYPPTSFSSIVRTAGNGVVFNLNNPQAGCIQIQNAQFTDCKALGGVGGIIYVDNLPSSESVAVDFPSTAFTNCKGTKGHVAYLKISAGSDVSAADIQSAWATPSESLIMPSDYIFASSDGTETSIYPNETTSLLVDPVRGDDTYTSGGTEKDCGTISKWPCATLSTALTNAANTNADAITMIAGDHPAETSQLTIAKPLSISGGSGTSQDASVYYAVTKNITAVSDGAVFYLSNSITGNADTVEFKTITFVLHSFLDNLLTSHVMQSASKGVLALSQLQFIPSTDTQRIATPLKQSVVLVEDGSLVLTDVAFEHIRLAKDFSLLDTSAGGDLTLSGSSFVNISLANRPLIAPKTGENPLRFGDAQSIFRSVRRKNGNGSVLNIDGSTTPSTIAFKSAFFDACSAEWGGALYLTLGHSSTQFTFGDGLDFTDCITTNGMGFFLLVDAGSATEKPALTFTPTMSAGAYARDIMAIYNQGQCETLLTLSTTGTELVADATVGIDEEGCGFPSPGPCRTIDYVFAKLTNTITRVVLEDRSYTAWSQAISISATLEMVGSVADGDPAVVTITPPGVFTITSSLPDSGLVQFNRIQFQLSSGSGDTVSAFTSASSGTLSFSDDVFTMSSSDYLAEDAALPGSCITLSAGKLSIESSTFMNILLNKAPLITVTTIAALGSIEKPVHFSNIYRTDEGHGAVLEYAVPSSGLDLRYATFEDCGTWTASLTDQQTGAAVKLTLHQSGELKLSADSFVSKNFTVESMPLHAMGAWLVATAETATANRELLLSLTSALHDSTSWYSLYKKHRITIGTSSIPLSHYMLSPIDAYIADYLTRLSVSVSSSGTLSQSCGWSDNPCPSVTAAYSSSDDISTITIAAGTHSPTAISQSSIQHSITIEGAGKAETQVSGTPTFSSDSAGEVTVSDLGISTTSASFFVNTGASLVRLMRIQFTRKDSTLSTNLIASSQGTMLLSNIEASSLAFSECGMVAITGGALVVDECVFEVIKSTVTAAEASSVITMTVSSDGFLYIAASDFLSCGTTGHGGAVCITIASDSTSSPAVSIQSTAKATKFQDCTSGTNGVGGAIYLRSYVEPDLYLANIQFTGIAAAQAGRYIYYESLTATTADLTGAVVSELLKGQDTSTEGNFVYKDYGASPADMTTFLAGKTVSATIKATLGTNEECSGRAPVCTSLGEAVTQINSSPVYMENTITVDSTVTHLSKPHVSLRMQRGVRLTAAAADGCTLPIDTAITTDAVFVLHASTVDCLFECSGLTFTISSGVASTDCLRVPLFLLAEDETATASLLLKSCTVTSAATNNCGVRGTLINAANGILLLQEVTVSSVTVLTSAPLLSISPMAGRLQLLTGRTANRFEKIERSVGSGAVLEVELVTGHMLQIENTEFADCSCTHTTGEVADAVAGAVYIHLIDGDASGLILNPLTDSAFSTSGEWGTAHTSAITFRTPSLQKLSAFSAISSLVPTFPATTDSSIYKYYAQLSTEESAPVPLCYALFSPLTVQQYLAIGTDASVEGLGWDRYPFGTVDYALEYLAGQSIDQENPVELRLTSGSHQDATITITTPVRLVGNTKDRANVVLASAYAFTTASVDYLSVSSAVTAVVSDLTIEFSSAYNGGVSRSIISLSDDSQLELHSTTIKDKAEVKTAIESPVIDAEDGKLILNDVVFETITLEDTPLLTVSTEKDMFAIQSATFSSVTRNIGGGSILNVNLDHSTDHLVIQNAKFTDCHSSTADGGVFFITVSNQATLSISSCFFTSCSAGSAQTERILSNANCRGGVIYLQITGTPSVILNNIAATSCTCDSADGGNVLYVHYHLVENQTLSEDFWKTMMSHVSGASSKDYLAVVTDDEGTESEPVHLSQYQHYEEEEEDSHFPVWAIVLIVVGSVVILAVVAILIILFIRSK